jgi:hypothetical protein
MPALAVDVLPLEEMGVRLLGQVAGGALVVKAALGLMEGFACWWEFHAKFENELSLQKARFVGGGKTIPVN